jgi:hypothetical protein
MDLNFWTQEWPLIRDAPHLAIDGAIVIALAVWALVSWAYRRKIAVLKAERGTWEARLAFAHEREAVVSQKRNELEATVQLLSNQTTANATAQEIAATTQRVTVVARELASANSACLKHLSCDPKEAPVTGITCDGCSFRPRDAAQARLTRLAKASACRRLPSIAPRHWRGNWRFLLSST